MNATVLSKGNIVAFFVGTLLWQWFIKYEEEYKLVDI